jgi:ribose 1,5-bisphosphokinase PhnN
MTGKRVVWRKPGKRYGIPVEIVAVNIQKGTVQVFEINTRKTRYVPADQLSAK